MFLQLFNSFVKSITRHQFRWIRRNKPPRKNIQIRTDITTKAAFGYINTLLDEKKFSKLATVINSIDMSKRKNSYGYGYGKKYGYGYGKRYGYGYGYGYETNEKKKSEGK